MMPSPNDLVTVAPTGAGAPVDGIVFDTPSRAKVVVAVMDRARGPVLRTVSARAVSLREQAGDHDQALQLLVRRTPHPSRGTAPGPASGGKGRAGFTRGTAHRPTGR